jgi:hypothetical protein
VAKINEWTGEFVWLFTVLALLAVVAALAAVLLPGGMRRDSVPAAAE